MQMKRISSEAEKLCRKEHEARKELAHREKELATAEGCAADALVKKRAVSDLMSAVLARRLQSAPATENCAEATRHKQPRRLRILSESGAGCASRRVE